MKVELIYEQSCPNIEAARARLIKAFHHIGLPATWHEWEVSEPDTPEYARHYGSPTILVDGKDVSGNAAQPNGGNSCRVYASDNGYEPVPPIRQIAGALAQAAKANSKSRGLGMTALPSVGIALLPKLTCPVCWPAYTALLSSAGIGFIDYTPYLLPVISIFLAITLLALAYRARARRGYGPFWIGVAGSISVLIGKFIMENEFALYFGVALLIGASLWNIWPRNVRRQLEPISTE